jgi:hypothetical protein
MESNFQAAARQRFSGNNPIHETNLRQWWHNSKLAMLEF